MAIDEPCEPWAVNPTCCPGWVTADDAPPVVDEEDPTDEEVAATATFNARLAAQESAVRWATTVLWKRSGRKIGVCTDTVRICPPCCYCDPCRCGPRHVLALSMSRPVVDIASVTDICSATVIDPDRYSIVNASGLALIDGTCSWLIGIACELEIEFSHGWEPDAEAVAAMSELACEYVKYCLGEACRKDAIIKLAATHRQGKRSTVLTGLPLVDLFLIEARAAGNVGLMDASADQPYSLA